MYKDREHWSLWTGVEVEGRYAGLQTLFTGAKAVADRVIDVLTTQNAPVHLYVNPHTLVQWDSQELVRVVGAWVRAGRAVTIACWPHQVDHATSVRTRFALRYDVHVMVILDGAHWMDLLHPDDTIRIDKGPYRVLCATVDQFKYTHHDDYKGDTQVM